MQKKGKSFAAAPLSTRAAPFWPISGPAPSAPRRKFPRRTSAPAAETAAQTTRPEAFTPATGQPYPTARARGPRLACNCDPPRQKIPIQRPQAPSRRAAFHPRRDAPAKIRPKIPQKEGKRTTAKAERFRASPLSDTHGSCRQRTCLRRIHDSICAKSRANPAAGIDRRCQTHRKSPRRGVAPCIARCCSACIDAR